MNKDEKYRSFLLRFGCVASMALIAFVFIKYLFGPMLPFLIAITVAALVHPLVLRLTEKTRLGHSVAATLLVLLCYILTVGLAMLLIVGLLSLAVDWAGRLPDMFTDTVIPWITRSSEELLLFAGMLDPSVGELVEQLVPEAISAVSGAVMDFSVSLVSWASSVGTALPGALLAMVICVIATVFAASDYERISTAILSMLPERARLLLDQIKTAIKGIVVNFLRSYALILLITFMEVSLGLIIIGFDNAVVIAALIAIFDILPIVGSGMVLLPWTIFKFIQGEIGRGIGLGILYVVVIVARQVIEPRIVSKRMGLHPLSTLFFMWVGLKTLGGVGMFALPLIVITLKDLKETGALNLPVADARHSGAVDIKEEVN